MSIETKIISLGVSDVDNLSDVVVRVTWQIIATTNKFHEESVPVQLFAGGKTVLDLSQLDNFTDYNNLTEQQIIDWIKESEEYKSEMTKIEKELKNKNAPPTMIKQLPWS